MRVRVSDQPLEIEGLHGGNPEAWVLSVALSQPCRVALGHLTQQRRPLVCKSVGCEVVWPLCHISAVGSGAPETLRLEVTCS